MSVSQATRLRGSCASRASRTESLIWSAILSGWPSVTDSDVKRRRDTSCSLVRWGVAREYRGRPDTPPLRHPETQAVVSDDRFVARVDLLFREERLVVEADGFRFHSQRT